MKVTTERNLKSIVIEKPYLVRSIKLQQVITSLFGIETLSSTTC
jgi:hypothetical protein